MFTGKNKEQFEKWYEKDYRKKNSIGSYHFFKRLSFEMQLGVYLAYADSLGYDVESDCEAPNCYTSGIFNNNLSPRDENYYTPVITTSREPLVNTRQEAYKEAFKELDRLINNTKN